jgi:hypothetical protein
MPKFVIERQYLVPMYQHIVVEAETLEEACKTGISDDISWDSQEMDCDSARARGLPLDMLTLATFLYEDEAKTGPRLEIPAKFTEDE